MPKGPNYSPGSPEIFTDLLSPEAAAVVPVVAATITDIEEDSISAIRQTAENELALVSGGKLAFSPIDVSRVALAARLQVIQEIPGK